MEQRAPGRGVAGTAGRAPRSRGGVEVAATLWYKPGSPAAVGLPAPIARLLESP